jgi:hypothetical protein
LFNINNIAISERIGEVPLVEQELLSDKDDNKNCALVERALLSVKDDN